MIFGRQNAAPTKWRVGWASFGKSRVLGGVRPYDMGREIWIMLGKSVGDDGNLPV